MWIHEKYFSIISRCQVLIQNMKILVEKKFTFLNFRLIVIKRTLLAGTIACKETLQLTGPILHCFGVRIWYINFSFIHWGVHWILEASIGSLNFIIPCFFYMFLSAKLINVTKHLFGTWPPIEKLINGTLGMHPEW